MNYQSKIYLVFYTRRSKVSTLGAIFVSFMFMATKGFIPPTSSRFFVHPTGRLPERYATFCLTTKSNLKIWWVSSNVDGQLWHGSAACVVVEPWYGKTESVFTSQQLSSECPNKLWIWIVLTCFFHYPFIVRPFVPRTGPSGILISEQPACQVLTRNCKANHRRVGAYNFFYITNPLKFITKWTIMLLMGSFLANKLI